MTRPPASTRRVDLRRGIAPLIVAALAACAQTPPSPGDKSPPVKPKLDVAAYQAMIVDARALIDQKRAAEAITKDLDPVIDAYDRAYGASAIAYFSTRSLPETLLYMATSVTRPTGVADVPGGPSAVALDQTWSGALYLKGYAYVELHRFAEAHEPLEHAVRLAPSNSQYLSELGQLYTVEKNWPKALDLFARAERGAEISPSAVKTKELTRALRGTAYVDVEIGKLDEAEALYGRCLVLDPTDAKATGELRYVRAQQAKQISR